MSPTKVFSNLIETWLKDSSHSQKEVVLKDLILKVLQLILRITTDLNKMVGISTLNSNLAITMKITSSTLICKRMARAKWVSEVSTQIATLTLITINSSWLRRRINALRFSRVAARSMTSSKRLRQIRI